MKRSFFVLLLTALLLTGCAPARPADAPAPADAVTFTDDLGRTVAVPRPSRVAALIGSFADIWCLAGGRDTLVAAAGDAWTGFDLGLEETVVNLGGVKSPDLEALIASAPDLVLVSANTAAQVELLPTLENMGLTCAYFNVSSFEDYLNMLDICTQLTGCPDNYQRYGADVQAQVEAARLRQDGSAPTVLYVRSTGVSCKVKNSRDSVLGEMLADLGCINIADNGDSRLESLSMEAILQADPDYVFAVLQGSDPAPARRTLEQELLSNPAWNGLTAVREGRFHILDAQLYNLKPNARWGEAYENLAQILYP